MKKTIIISLALLSLFLLFCKEETPLEDDSRFNDFTGKIYVIVDSQKVYLENVKVLLNGDSTFTNNDGLFSFKEVPNGEYLVTFLFSSSSHSFVRNKSLSIISNQENKTEEYLVYQEAVFKGKVFTEVNNARIDIENATIYFLGNTTTTDIDGNFSLKYDFSKYEGIKISFKIVYNEDYFEVTETLLLEEISYYDEYYMFPKIELTIELFTIRDSERTLLNDSYVRLDGNLLQAIGEGKYSIGNLKYGTYNLTINHSFFYSITDSINLNSTENVLSYEMTNLVDEDIIYVQNNNYYFRNAEGEITQITYSNESISSDIECFNDKNRFLYVSYTGSSYKINEISLNPIQHRVVYESESAIRTVRISSNQEDIYFIKSLTDYWSGSINSFNLNTLQNTVVDAGPYYEAFLLHDCMRIAFEKRAGKSDFRNYIIKDFINSDSTIIANVHMEKGGGIKAISPNDNYILLNFNYDGIPNTTIYGIIADEYVNNGDNDGHGMRKFTDDSEKYYGVLSDSHSDRPYPVVVIDINSGAKTIIDESNSYYGLNTLSYSEKSNKYLYSLDGDIKTYDVATRKSYNFIATDDDESCARFINP